METTCNLITTLRDATCVIFRGHLNKKYGLIAALCTSWHFAELDKDIHIENDATTALCTSCYLNNEAKLKSYLEYSGHHMLLQGYKHAPFCNNCLANLCITRPALNCSICTHTYMSTSYQIVASKRRQGIISTTLYDHNNKKSYVTTRAEDCRGMFHAHILT